WIKIDTSFGGSIFLSIEPIFPLSIIGHMDQFWSTLVIYPDGIGPSTGEKILTWRKRVSVPITLNSLST
ncbi:unnamed protein product, partial [marine sediment metagenome]